MNRKSSSTDVGEGIKSLKPYLLIGLLILITAIIIKDCHGGNKAETKPVYKYLTDSLYYKKYWELKKEITEKTPPIQVIKWLDTIVDIDTIYIKGDIVKVVVKDKDTLNINSQFISQYPDNPKLLEFKLGHDELEITTFTKDAKTYTDKYPLYLHDYKYQWYDNSLHHEPTNYKENKTFKWNQLYVNGGYSKTESAGLIGLEYNLNYNRFKLDLDTDITIEENPNLLFKAKLGYQLFD